MQFTCYDQQFPDSNPSHCFEFASYYTITCIDNRQSNASDFTFDINRVKLGSPNSGDLFTKDSSRFFWNNSLLLASSIFVQRGQAANPNQPYAFIFQINQPSNGDRGAFHTLRYDSIQGQPVLMNVDTDIPPPQFVDFANITYFQHGQVMGTNIPILPPPRCF
jgi:hypothetical protein